MTQLPHEMHCRIPIAEWDFQYADDALTVTINYDGDGWIMHISHALHGPAAEWGPLLQRHPMGRTARVIEGGSLRTLETCFAIARRYLHAYGQGDTVISTWNMAAQKYDPLIIERRAQV